MDVNNPNNKNLEGKPICCVIKHGFTTNTTEWVTVGWDTVAFFPHLHLVHINKEVFKVFRIEISAWELVLDVWVIDVCCREHALDFELRWHINVIIHQGFELDTGDLWPWNINS